MKILAFIIFFVIPCIAVFWVSYKGEQNTKLTNKKNNKNENKSNNN